MTISTFRTELGFCPASRSAAVLPERGCPVTLAHQRSALNPASPSRSSGSRSQPPSIPDTAPPPLPLGPAAPQTPRAQTPARTAALRVVPGSTAGLCLALELCGEGKPLPLDGTAQPGPARRLQPRVPSPGPGRADPGDSGSFRATPDHFSPGTWGPRKVCSYLPFFTAGVGDDDPPPLRTLRARSSPPRKQLPSAGGSTLFSLSPPELSHLSLTFPGPAAVLPVPTSLSPSPICSGAGALPERCG